MEKIILKHLTVTGFAKGIDLSRCEALEKKLESAQIKLVAAQKEVNETKEKLSIAVAESLKKLEEKENKMIKDIKSTSNDDSAFGIEDIKATYTHTMAELEAKKNEIQKKLSEYRADGTEKWDSFKQNLNQDLEELGKALKNFTTK
jgi:cell division septum initiation protein DivIVA